MRLTALPVGVDDGEVDRPADEGPGRRAGPGPRAAGSIRAASAAMRASSSEVVDRDVARLGIGEVASRSAKASLAASSWRWIHAASVQPRAPKRGPGRRLEPLEDAQDLERDDPAAVRRVGRHADAAVGVAIGAAARRAVVAQVGDA